MVPLKLSIAERVFDKCHGDCASSGRFMTAVRKVNKTYAADRGIVPCARDDVSTGGEYLCYFRSCIAKFIVLMVNAIINIKRLCLKNT